MTMTLEVKIQEVGNKLLQLLEQGVSPWQKDWQLRGGGFCNASTGKPYHGQNTILLMIECFVRGYSTSLFIGFSQAQDMGLRMIKGSKACPILYPKIVKKTDEETGEEKKVVIGWRWANVFNLDCFENTPIKQQILNRFNQQDQGQTLTPPQFVQQLLDDHQPHLVFLSTCNPSYSPDRDTVFMPPIECFQSAAGYAATLIHELAHWTGHKSRLNRTQVGYQQCSQSYAYEELVAEMTAAILCVEAAIPYALENHASYIGHWMNLIRHDKTAFIRALKDAGRASAFLCPPSDD